MGNTPRKLNGGVESELIKLKRLWLKPEFEQYQETWRERFASGLTQLQIRNMLRDQLQINLLWDRQLTQFRQWVERQDALDAERTAMADDVDRILEEFGGDWTLEQVRDEILKRSYVRALATGDFESGRRTIAQEMNVKKVELDRVKTENWKWADRAKVLEAYLEETRKHPGVRQKFMAALAALEQAEKEEALKEEQERQGRQKEWEKWKEWKKQQTGEYR